MFIKKIKSPKGDVYLQLVESYRQGKKVLHRTLTPLGKAGDGRMESLIQAVSRYTGEKTAEDFLAKSPKNQGRAGKKRRRLQEDKKQRS